MLLVEKVDFASGTSSRSSKLVHGGLRYIGEGQPGVTREACRERDLLLRQNPNLVRPLPFLFPAWDDSKVPLWQVRARTATLDQAGRQARYRDAVVEFAGIPTFWTPYLQHPAGDAPRQSGFLSPTFGITNFLGGFVETAQPGRAGGSPRDAAYDEHALTVGDGHAGGTSRPLCRSLLAPPAR